MKPEESKLSKELIHKDCGGNIVVSFGNGGQCGDPDCCGEVTYDATFKCNKCNKKEYTGSSEWND